MTDIRGKLADLSPEQRKLLAMRLRAQKPPAQPPSDDAPAREGGTFPLSFAQQRLWVLDRLEPGSAAYNISQALRVRGALDVAAWERALGELVRRHEALRTHLGGEGGEEPVQVVSPFAGFALPVERLEPGESVDAAFIRIAAEEANRPFRLDAPPLYRARLVRATAEDHLFVLTLHHAITDGWSNGVLLAELAALYEAFVDGRPSPLPPVRVQYGDHAVRERVALSGDALAARVRWWTERLSGAPPLLELPTDHPRPPVQSHRGATHAFLLPPGVAERVHRLAREADATPFMVLLAAFQVMLHRMTGQDDVLVGTPVANRATTDVEGTVGFFANTLVLRGDLSGRPPFRALLDRARDATLGAFEHQDLPFEKLVEELQPERSLAHAPVFQVLFVLQNLAQPGASDGPAGIGGLTLEPVGRARETAKFDLTLTLAEAEGRLQGAFEYATDLFAPETIQRWAERFGVLVDAALTAPDTPIDSLPWMTAAEASEIVAFEAGPTPETAPEETLLDAFLARAAAEPDAVALAFEGRTMTYGALAAASRRLAGRLREAGAGPETPVAVLAERSLEMVVALYGAVRAGAAYVPVDPEHPDERIAYVLADSGAPVVLAQTHLLERLPAGVRPIALESIGDGPDGSAPPSPDPDSLAYLLYTSGSTGRPKGAGNAHRGIVNRLAWMQETFPLGPEDVVLHKTPFSFDVSVWEFFWPMRAGARLVVAPPGVHRDPTALSELIREAGVTTIHFVPSMLALWLDDPSSAACTGLRRVMSSGEALPADLVRRFHARLPGVELHNLYGPTEAAVDVTWWPCSPGDPRPAIPIGKPIAHTRMHVLDPAGGRCPVGVPGELFIAGVQVGRGYLGRPALTAERFVPDPFSPAPGARMYRTGDRARWTAEGVIEYLGRLDFQVKIRGLRIELGEIETALLAHPGVREAVVDARPDATGAPTLVAWFVAEGAVPATDALREHLRATLPEYMVPGAFVAREAMPLTSSGKVDRRALPAPDRPAGGVFVAPRTPVEEVVAGIWADLLGAPRVGSADHFFDLGGHSLAATRVVSRIRDALGAEVPLRALFEAPVLADFAARVERARRGGGAVPPVTPRERAGTIPLSFAQERLWFIDALTPGNRAYTLPIAAHLPGALDEGALRRALNGLVRRHEALRTLFVLDGEAPVQVVRPPYEVFLPVVDLSSEEDPDPRIAALRAEELDTPFDLEIGPLFRARLVRLADGHLLMMTMHHIVGDGWSNGILLRELRALYDAEVRGEPAALPDLPVQYADYAVWQRGWLTGAELERQAAYWRGRLAGAPPVLELPTDRPRAPLHQPRGASMAVAVPAEASAAVDALARREGATPFMVYLAAFAALLARYAGEEDVVVGTPIANRQRPELEGLVGFFVNTLALRTDLSGDPSFRALLARVRDAALGAYEHQDLPFEKLVEELHPERSLSHSPVFQVLFAMQNAPGEGPAAGAAVDVDAASGAVLEGGSAKLDLSLSLTRVGDRVAGSFLYDAELFEADTIRRLAGHFSTMLTALTTAPDAPLSTHDGLAPGEAERLLAAGVGEAVPAGGSAVHAPIEAWARRTPDAPAVRLEDRVLSFAELDGAAERLARRLRAAGVGPDVPVGVCLDPVPEIVVAFLAALKAGGAFLPLDPQYPPERLAFLLADSRARVVVTERRLRARFDGAEGVTVLAIDDAEEAAPFAPAEPHPAQLAYVIYTSGSTGTPKGVGVPHGPAAAHLRAVAARWGLTPADRYQHFVSPSFDVFVEQVMAPLTAGASVILRGPLVWTTAELADHLRARRPTVASLPTAYWQQIAAEPEAVAAAAETLRVLYVGGEAMPPEAAARWRRADGGRVVLANVYGPTETVVSATAWAVPADFAEGAARVPIGGPVAGRRLSVRDSALRPVPEGVPGELFIGGELLARGYLRRPALTAERFLPDPSSDVPGARLYRTGDRVRWRTDGTVEFLGRIDQQVKVRGLRIEPGEVEGALARHPAVRDAAVVARPDASGSMRLVGYYVVAPDAQIPAEEVRAHLKRSLPDYMVPAALVEMEAFPLTPNGKVDRRALPEPTSATADEGYVPPYSALQIELADVWQEVLEVPRVGLADSFFALGGHSLLAVKLMARVRERFGADIPLAELFLSPTLGEMADRLERGADPTYHPLVALHAGGDLPPLYCIHPAGGTVFCYMDLARRLAPARPLYGLQAPGLTGGEAPAESVDELAETFSTAILEREGDRPVLLGGWSAGGVIAFETARRIREKGGAVGRVVLFDAYPPAETDRLDQVPDEVGLYREFVAGLAGVASETLEPLAEELRALPPEAREEAVAAWMRRSGAVPPAVVRELGRSVRVFRGVADAVARYRGAPFDGPVLLLLAEDSLARQKAEDELEGGWRRWAPALEAVRLPGTNHGTFVLEPQVSRVAEAVRAALDPPPEPAG